MHNLCEVNMRRLSRLGLACSLTSCSIAIENIISSLNHHGSRPSPNRWLRAHSIQGIVLALILSSPIPPFFSFLLSDQADPYPTNSATSPHAVSDLRITFSPWVSSVPMGFIGRDRGYGSRSMLLRVFLSFSAERGGRGL